MKEESGFSLIELLVVVTIIGIIAAIAVPSLRKARQNAQAGSAIQSVRTLSTAEILYYRDAEAYGPLTDLVPDGSLDSNLQAGFKSGYTFTVSTTPDLKHFSVNADPVDDAAVFNHFYGDDTGVIRVQTGAVATAASAAIQ